MTDDSFPVASTSPVWASRNDFARQFRGHVDQDVFRGGREEIDQAIKELFRICRVGVLFHGTTTDMTEEVIRDHELFAGLQTFWTFSEWSDAFVRNGFQLAVSSSVMLDQIWQIEQEADPDDWDWYPTKESVRYSYFSKP